MARKICKYCGEEFECSDSLVRIRVTCGKKECLLANVQANRKRRYVKPKPNPKNFGKCPLLRVCGKYGINCSKRDYRTCDYFRKERGVFQ